MTFRMAAIAISLSIFSVLPTAANSGNQAPTIPVWRQQLTVAVDEFMQAWSQQAKLSEATQVSYEVKGLDPRLRLTPCEQTPSISTGQNFRAGKLTLRSECSLPHPWKLFVSVQVERLHPVVVITSSLPRGSRITESDLQLRQQNIDRLNYGYFTNIKDAVGMISKRSLQSAQVLSPNHLTPPLLISKGDSVLIEASNNEISVKMPGMAMSDGRMGQQISVRNKQSQRTIRAEVVASGVVKVPL